MDLVFFFSGTGNSLSVAKALSDKPLNIAAIEPAEFKADTIGFVFPVYCFLPPPVVAEFIKKSKFESPYIWAVATCGGGAGAALSETHRLLKTSGGLSYAADITLPDNSIIFKPSEDEMKKLWDEESMKVSSIKEDIAARIIKRPKPAGASAVMGKLSWFALKTVYGAKNPRSNEKCSNCGLCARLCPAQNISAVQNGVVFGKKCEYCFGCIHFCPANAIEFGRIKRGDGEGYRHPTVTAADLINSREI